MKRAFAILVLLVACKHDGGTTTPTGGAGSGSAAAAPVVDKRTPYEQRRDVACHKLGKRITACAVEDAKKQVAAGKLKQTDFNEITKPEILAKNTDEATEACMKIVTTHQLRVVEVCQEQESECDPMNACLEHVNDGEPAAKP